jgi:hypothetical protein
VFSVFRGGLRQFPHGPSAEETLTSLPPISKEFTRTIAERELTMVQGGRRRRLLLRIGEPIQDVQTVDSMDWRCPIEIIVDDQQPVAAGRGVDSLQALINAIRIAQIELESLERGSGSTNRMARSIWFSFAAI